MRTPSRKLLALSLTCLLLSFTLQLPLAWALTYLSRTHARIFPPIDILVPGPEDSDLDTDTQTLSIFVCTFPGVRTISVMANAPLAKSRRFLEHNTVAPGAPEVLAAAAPWPAESLHPALTDPAAWPHRTGAYSRPNMSYSAHLVSCYAAGWPFLCAEGRIDSIGTTQSARTQRISGIITDPAFFPTSGVGYLVYHPRWPAYLANTLIDGTLLAALILSIALTLRTLRSHRRTRKGLCPTCAYDLRATPRNQPCPECGHSAPSPAPAGEVVEALRDRRG
jgi:hypothetical protein